MLTTVTVLLIIFLFLAIACFTFIGEYVLIINFIKGCMLGTLYNCDIIEEENINEHTLQICLFVLCFTFIWETELKK